MATFLFVAQPAMGHLNPMLAIARALRQKGHSVVFATAALKNIRSAIVNDGFRFENVRPSLNILGLLFLPFFSGFWETLVAMRCFFSSIPYYARAIGRIVDRVQPDAVVSDFSFPGAGLAAESKSLPYVIIYQVGLCFKGDGIPPFGSGLPIGKPECPKERFYRYMSDFMEKDIVGIIFRGRKRLNLPEGKNTFTPVSSPWLNLVLTAEASEAPRFPLPPETFFIGPCIAGSKDFQNNSFPFDELSDKPRIFVSLGTVFNNKPRVFKKIIGFFEDKPYQLIISAGKAFSRLNSCKFASNILLFERVPQVEILPYIDVVISHGGNNTVNETLSVGKPMLIMPVGGEQADNASRVVYLGVGLRADIKRSTSEEIYTKVKRLVEEPLFRQRAKEIANALALTQGPITAARFIERVAQNRQPLLRPEGYPLTVTRETVPPWEFKNV